MLAEPICPKEYVVISSIGDEKIGKFGVLGTHFYLERRSVVNCSLGVDCSINISWIDGALYSAGQAKSTKNLVPKPKPFWKNSVQIRVQGG